MADLPETIFGHIPSGSEYNPPIPQTDVSYLEADLSIRPVKDDDNPSDTTTFSSNKIITYLSTKLDDGLTGDVNKYLKWTATGQEWSDVPTATVTSQETAIATITNSVLAFPNMSMGSSGNLVMGVDAGKYSWLAGRTVAIGDSCCFNSQSTDGTVAIGTNCLQQGFNNDESVCIGDRSCYNRRQSKLTAIGCNSGRIHNHGTDGLASAGYEKNIFLGHSAGVDFLQGSNNIFIGCGVTKGTASDTLLIGKGSTHLITGVFGTAANAEIELNADTFKLPSTLKTQADLSSIAVGTVYVDTSDGNTLKLKL